MTTRGNYLVMITPASDILMAGDSLRMPPIVAETKMTSTVRGGSITRLIAIVVVLTALFGALVAGSPETAKAETVSTGQELVVNGTFETGVGGWRTNHSYTSLAAASPGHSGSRSAVLTTSAGTNAVLNDRQSTVASTVAGEEFRVSAWVRTNSAGLAGQLRIREVLNGNVRTVAQPYTLNGTGWQLVELSVVAASTGAGFDLNVLGWSLSSGQELWVDDVSLRKVANATGEPTVEPGGALVLSNGVAISSRGVPSRGALFGAAVGSNTDPANFEKSIGQRLGVRRTYWTASQVDSAVNTARTDLSNGRLPWISFKVPYSWGRMAAGDGDAWARDLATRLAQLPGPVWVAFHHEPEGDGVIKDWTAMQRRLGPIVRGAAPNVGFSIILTGWHQLYGESQYSLASLWPATTVDVAGFDVYNAYGTVKDGVLRLKPTDMRGAYFEPLSQWAKSKGVAWGLAESGYTDRAAADYPSWLVDTYDDLVATGGVAYAYFNSSLNSQGSWVITTSSKTMQFSTAIKRTPQFPKLT
jgi:FlaG/FlaF family flagellin (archaellin)